MRTVNGPHRTLLRTRPHPPQTTRPAIVAAMTDQPIHRLGLWPTCGHAGPDAGTCLRPRGHRERADGTGPMPHRDGEHQWEEQPAAADPWWPPFTDEDVRAEGQ